MNGVNIPLPVVPQVPPGPAPQDGEVGAVFKSLAHQLNVNVVAQAGRCQSREEEWHVWENVRRHACR